VILGNEQEKMQLIFLIRCVFDFFCIFFVEHNSKYGIMVMKGIEVDDKKYEVIFYSNSKGNEPVKEYIKDLRAKSPTNKNARVKFNKITAYIDLLCEDGTRIGEPVTKHIDGDIWELRPLDSRILYAYYKDDKFILLHHFIKRKNKLPQREFEKAKRNLADYRERNDK